MPDLHAPWTLREVENGWEIVDAETACIATRIQSKRTAQFISALPEIVRELEEQCAMCDCLYSCEPPHGGPKCGECGIDKVLRKAGLR